MDNLKINQPQKFVFSCEECGEDIEMSPPDHVHTICNVKSCIVCEYGDSSNQVKSMKECDSCDKRNTRYWHSKATHTTMQYIQAKQKQDDEFINSIARRLK